ncbi:hypothetical protein [Alishewanella jeotgali]|uniref:Uncharacterized protein n=1 Tax=Alishewanella jeotgali KCTC 22429 TaxID=1129374 RepID=H3ZBJ5_9ALTE|nr:hypothetical protein [Alishewanella jeotgali]EHR42309.1 hypothetical protein AJE_03501 [Alishewanella jeotgali KCTC 22429]
MNFDQLYRQTMGPYFFEFCQRLHALATMYSAVGNTTLYFCRRSGIVLYEFYKMFLAANRISPGYEMRDFPVSRLVVVKAALAESSLWGGHMCSVMFPQKTIRYLIAKLLESQEVICPIKYTAFFEENILNSTITPGSVSKWLAVDALIDGNMDSISSYLLYQRELLLANFPSRPGDNAVIVDSGLYGTVSEVLSGLFPDVRCISGFVYFSNYKKVNPVSHQDFIYGLMGSSAAASLELNHTAVLRHWHFIEKLLEPDNISSMSDFSSFQPNVNLVLNNEQSSIAEFFRSPLPYDINSVLNVINRVLSHPSPSELEIIYSSERRDDASGETRRILIPRSLELSIRKSDALRRVNYGIIRRSLWHEGQIVLSYGWLGFVYNGFRYYTVRVKTLFFSKFIARLLGL